MDRLWPGVSREGRRPTGAAILTWGYSERRCTAVSGPESWGLGLLHRTAHRNGGVGNTGTQVTSLLLGPPMASPDTPYHYSDVLGQVLGAAHQEVREGRLWKTEGVSSSGAFLHHGVTGLL